MDAALFTDQQIMNMADLTADIPSNEKSCQTDELDEKAPALRPEHLSQIPAYCREPGDPPLLQRQLQTSKSGIQQIIECFRTGTTQLKHILIKEVDTIFECKLCRSLFRGLPNLITHKEFYCFPRLPEPEPSGNCRQTLAIKELLEVIYPRSKQEEHVVRLEPIPGNKNAVFQHLTNQSDVGLQSPGQSSTHSTEDWTHNQQESQEKDVGEHNAGGEIENEEANERNEEAHEDNGVQEDENEQEDAGKEEVISGDLDDVTVTCCLCGKGFSSRRSVRRHCHEVHKQRLDELRKFTETHTVPISLLSVVKERQVHSPGPNGKCCPVCLKTFTTKANVWRHFDEVHRGLQHDLITFDGSTTSSDLEAKPAKACAPHSPNSKTVSLLPQYNLATCKCLLCKRSYSTQARLKRHMHFVHKILAGKCSDSSSSADRKLQSEEDADTKRLKRPREEDKDEKSPVLRKPKLSVGFDFKQLFCKLCNRQFSSRQNLAKHIELHTDNGGDIFIKFYRCPMCCYESRRKRDVLRHVTVVHKKNSAYLAKILPALESRAVKKPVETVLGSSVKRGHAKDPDGHDKGDTTSSHSPEKVRVLPSVPPVIHKQDVPPPSPPVTRKQSLSLHTPSVTCNQNSKGIANSEEAQDSTEVHVTKNFSLHACDICGRAFAKKVYLESHKRSHRNTTKTNGRTVGVSTRSKSLLW